MKKNLFKSIFCMAVMAAALLFAVPAQAHAEDVTTMAATADVYIRSGPGTNYSTVGAIPAGGVCQVYSMTPDGWYKVKYKGIEGYSYYKYINWEGSDSNTVNDGNYTMMYATAPLKIREQPNTSSKQVGSIPQGAGVKVSNKDSGWFKVDYNGTKGWAYGEYLAFGQGSASPAPSPAPSPASAKTMYTVCGLNLRAAADSSSSVLTVIPAYTELSVTADKYGWYKTSYNGKTGYVYGDYLSTTRQGTPASSTEGPKTNDTTGNTTYMYTTGGVNMRSGPGTGNSILTTLPAGAKVVCDKSQDGWYHVTYNGKTGWVSGQFLSMSSSGNAVVNDQALNTTMVTTGDVYMRKGPDKSYDQMCVVAAGTKVPVSYSKNGWYEVTYNGKTGWISGRFLK